ncbi:MAG: nucleotidyl transferase AbiEii/AbiGii toxin family protein [Rhodospirillales bacterium]|nr:nucleotidyl transferase AbiEii/AbiGii toxin family protein [Rhodospirillales bacterium]
MREYLQARILQELMRMGAMSPLAFMGGTALRFLYFTRRYSEDLDFSLEGSREAYDLDRWVKAIRRRFLHEAYGIDQTVRQQGAVHRVSFRFPGVLHEVGLSPHPAEALAVKLEVDINPPAGATTESSRVNRHVTLRLHHHDKASLLAGKLLAVLNRQWVKGRDYYDLAWYLGRADWPEPNMELLNSGIAQKGDRDVILTSDTWRGYVASRIADTPWAPVDSDIERFVEDRHDTLDKQEMLALLLDASKAP